jgi:hypothetical protein
MMMMMTSMNIIIINTTIITATISHYCRSLRNKIITRGADVPRGRRVIECSFYLQVMFIIETGADSNKRCSRNDGCNIGV